MIVVLPFHRGDAENAFQLLCFIEQLGGCRHYSLLLVADAGVDWGRCVDMLAVAERTFHSAHIITTVDPVEGWPQGANALWLTAAAHAKGRNVPWLWLEPDAIPVKRGWLIALDKMYRGGLFGCLYDWPQQAKKVMSGVAVYPADAIDTMGQWISLNRHIAFDVATADLAGVDAQHTNLIQHFWGEKDLPPTFVETKAPTSPRNAFTLANLSEHAVIFHRSKDGTLMELLRRNLSLAGAGNFVVVIGFCNLDVNLLLKNLSWMHAMGMAKTHDVLLSYDRTTITERVKEVKELAHRVFCNVMQTSYTLPNGIRFPQTYAWQHAARFMESIYRNWLWMEPDAIPLKPNWLSVLQSVYDNNSQPFMGSVVEGAGHLNGTPAIYPANTPELLPRTMSHCDNAWDCEAKDEMRRHGIKDIGHIAVAYWGIDAGRLNPLVGEPPSFPRGSPLLNQIPKTAVVFHRDKFGTLIDRLMEV